VREVKKVGGKGRKKKQFADAVTKPAEPAGDWQLGRLRDGDRREK
jgi:hypothetical protein